MTTTTYVCPSPVLQPRRLGLLHDYTRLKPQPNTGRHINEQSNNSAAPVLLTVDEACEQLGHISKSALYGLMRSGQLPSIKLGRRRLIPAAAVDVLVSQLVDQEFA
jgi:excisionase family DNA binding protein